MHPPLDFFLAAQQCVHRPWYVREFNRYPFHPIVMKALQRGPAHDWHELLLQHPHVAADGIRVAYTRNERKGEDDRQEVTSMGKYLKMHFSFPDHEIRELAAIKAGMEFKFIYNVKEMIEALMAGPTSCMSGDNWRDRHPYEAYDPEFGWSMAVRLDDGKVVGRTLCNDEVFVRTYGEKDSNGYSQNDDALESWLKEQGYQHVSGWPYGTKMAKIPGEPFMAPYLDGDNDGVSDHGNYLTISSDEEYRCDNTDGEPTRCNDNRRTCWDCEDYTDDDELFVAGADEDIEVCQCCIENRYTYVTGRRGNQYYLRDRYVIHAADGGSYDRNYLDDNNIIGLENGDYVSVDDAFCCAVDGNWYHIDDAVRAEDKPDDLVHSDNTWICEFSDCVYSDAVDFVTVAGEYLVHPENEAEFRADRGLPEDEEEPTDDDDPDEEPLEETVSDNLSTGPDITITLSAFSDLRPWPFSPAYLAEADQPAAPVLGNLPLRRMVGPDGSIYEVAFPRLNAIEPEPRSAYTFCGPMTIRNPFDAMLVTLDNL